MKFRSAVCSPLQHGPLDLWGLWLINVRLEWLDSGHHLYIFKFLLIRATPRNLGRDIVRLFVAKPCVLALWRWVIIESRCYKYAFLYATRACGVCSSTTASQIDWMMINTMTLNAVLWLTSCNTFRVTGFESHAAYTPSPQRVRNTIIAGNRKLYFPSVRDRDIVSYVICRPREVS